MVKRPAWIIAVVLLFALGTPVGAQAPFPDAHDDPPAGWTGPLFKLRQDYPTALPTGEAMPWKSFDFRTQPLQYLQSVLAYAYEGNIEVDWQLERNTRRNWYHAPWLHATDFGREFVHGLTRERRSPAGHLHPDQTDGFDAYAVGMYNPLGGFVIGQVWRDPENPNPALARFPDGAVAAKLLFSRATAAQVPYLRNTFEWEAHVRTSPSSNTRSNQTVRLIQIDVAVRDTRADSTTGWVFGTFVHDADAPGTRPWDRMVPVGLMWGNDPTLTLARFEAGTRARQTFINPAGRKAPHLGWLDRLNGPVDNQLSSCLSCHSVAQWPPRSGVVAAPAAFTPPATQAMRWFRNIRAGRPFDPGRQSLDYSLQLFEGIQRFHSAEPTR